MQQREQTDPAPQEPIDPDVDLHLARPTRHLATDAAVLAVVAVGGAIGATARYLIGLAWPTPAGGFPWTTLAINIVGCAVIGVFMVLITDVWTPHRHLRPFFGTGVLGGFTTFSTYAVDIQQLVDDRPPRHRLWLSRRDPARGARGGVARGDATRRVLARRQR